LEDPYLLVKDGKWTIDKIWDMAKDMPRDVNGDGVMDDADSYRLLTASHTIHGNGVFDMFTSLPFSKSPEFVSAYEKILPKIENDMQKAIDQFLEND